MIVTRDARMFNRTATRALTASPQKSLLVTEWFRLACSPPIVRRALSYAIGVGSLLIAINHGDAILRGDVPFARLWRMALTVTVPYCVSTASSVSAMRERNRLQQPPTI